MHCCDTIQDITLQHLCSPAMANIVEKCARLAIEDVYCIEALFKFKANGSL